MSSRWQRWTIPPSACARLLLLLLLLLMRKLLADSCLLGSTWNPDFVQLRLDLTNRYLFVLCATLSRVGVLSNAVAQN